MSRYIYISLYLFFSLSLSTSCNKKGQQGEAKRDIKRVFVAPDIPVMLTSQTDRLNYLVLHYFEKFDFKDTTAIHLPDLGEVGIINFIDLLPRVPETIKDSGVYKALKEASVEPKMYAFFWKTMGHYLNDPNSPVRNEDSYIAVCKSITRLPVVNEVISSNAAFDLRQALKNRAGKTAANFPVTLADGKNLKMNKIEGKYTLLFFYEPDCPTCIKTKAFLKKSPLLNGFIDSSILRLLAFYPGDDKELWLKLLPECSPKWINGYDKDGFFAEKQPYDLRAFPTFYLLDRNKKVLLKDIPIENILLYLRQNG